MPSNGWTGIAKCSSLGEVSLTFRLVNTKLNTIIRLQFPGESDPNTQTQHKHTFDFSWSMTGWGRLQTHAHTRTHTKPSDIPQTDIPIPLSCIVPDIPHKVAGLSWPRGAERLHSPTARKQRLEKINRDRGTERLLHSNAKKLWVTVLVWGLCGIVAISLEH